MTAGNTEFDTTAGVDERLAAIQVAQEALLERPNQPVDEGNGLYTRYRHPILTADHVPYFWRYDLDRAANPLLMQRMGINTVFNAGAIKLDERYLVVGRVEGTDRKSFFAVAESPNGVDRFRFWDYPITMPETDNPDVNV
ncbi:MAG: glycosidase, partial [Gemmatimonadota bacterium]